MHKRTIQRKIKKAYENKDFALWQFWQNVLVGSDGTHSYTRTVEFQHSITRRILTRKGIKEIYR